MQPTSSSPNWDVILMACLFIAGCLTVSVILPLWQEAHDAPHGMGTSVQVSAPAGDTPTPSGTVATIVPSPQQLRAASESYETGAQKLQAKNYQAAAVDFKKALEKYPAFTEAYAGLADAAGALGDDQAAVLNAQHALDQWANDQTMHVTELTPDAAKAWAHRLLGAALLRRADSELRRQQALLGKMDANRAVFHCKQALTINADDEAARRCAQSASALALRT